MGAQHASVYAAVSPSIVQVATGSAFGSGLKVAQGVLTNAHVVGDAARVTIFTINGREYPATVLKRDTVRDLALLETQAPLPAVPLAPALRHRQGDDVVVLGYPRPNALGKRWGTPTLSAGMISNFRTLNGVLVVQTDAAMNSGNSGGAVVNMQGQLIGIAKAGIRDSVALNFAVAVEEVASFLEAGAHPTAIPMAPERVAPTRTTRPSPDPTRILAPTQVPTPRPRPTEGPFPTFSSVPTERVDVGNTGDQGVCLRSAPQLADSLRAVPDGTELLVIGRDVSGDDRTWKHVRIPNGPEGYVPSECVLSAAEHKIAATATVRARATARARAASPVASPGYEEALRRIAVAGDGSGNVGCYSSPTFDNRTCLRLGELGLRQLPPEIGRLSNLEELWLDKNQLTTLPPRLGSPPTCRSCRSKVASSPT